MIVDQLLPEAKKLINDKILAVVKEKGPKIALTNLYSMLPFVIRTVVKEETFVNFCLSHQDKIFGASSQSEVAKAIKKVAPKKAVKTIKKLPSKAAKKTVLKKVAKKVK